MYLILFMFMFPIGFGALFTFIFNTYTNMPLGASIPISILIGIVLFALFVAILFFGYIPIAKRIKPTNKFNKVYIKQYAIFALFVTRIKLKVVGMENLKDFDLNNEKYILTPNHKSLMDVVAIYKMFPGIGFIAKKEVYDMPLIPAYFHAMGVVPIDRNNDRQAAKGILEGIKRVKNKEPMCIFTEGGIKTRETDRMVELKPGAFKLAIKAEANIIPISFKNNHLISKNSPKRKTKVTMYIHKPIRYEDYKDMSTQEIAEMVNKIVNSVL